MRKLICVLLILTLCLSLVGCAGDGVPEAQASVDVLNEEKLSDLQIYHDKTMRKNIKIEAVSTLDKTVCVLVKNNHAAVIEKLEIAVSFYDAKDKVIVVEKVEYHGLVPGYTVASRIDPPENYERFEAEIVAATEADPAYESYLHQINKSEKSSGDYVLLTMRNSSPVDVEKIEYIAVLYQGEDIAAVTRPQYITALKKGDIVNAEINTSAYKYDHFEVYINQVDAAI